MGCGKIWWCGALPIDQHLAEDCDLQYVLNEMPFSWALSSRFRFLLLINGVDGAWLLNLGT